MNVLSFGRVYVRIITIVNVLLEKVVQMFIYVQKTILVKSFRR